MNIFKVSQCAAIILGGIVGMAPALAVLYVLCCLNPLMIIGIVVACLGVYFTLRHDMRKNGIKTWKEYNAYLDFNEVQEKSRYWRNKTWEEARESWMKNY